MGRTEGCWANVLGDCDGRLTGEHLVSVAIWASRSGTENREGKLARSLTVTRGQDGSPQPTTVEDLVAPILCDRHNSSSHELDEAGGKLARAIEEFQRVRTDREKLITWPRPRHYWPRHCIQLHGPHIERWFIKTTINNAVEFGMPIGAADAPPGQPTNELAEIVFRGREIRRPMGLSLVTWVGSHHDFGERFSFMFYDRNGTHMAGCLCTFRTLVWVVKFETHETPDWVFQRVLRQSGALLVQPFRALLSSPPLNVRVQLNWPRAQVRRVR